MNWPVKIIFDGDKMSNKFKFKSFLYMKDFNFKNEAEERVECTDFDEQISKRQWNKYIPLNNCIVGVKKSIIGIEINCNGKERLYSIDQIKKHIEDIPIKLTCKATPDINKYKQYKV